VPSTSEPGPSVPPPRSERKSGTDAVRRFIICGDTPLAYRIADELISRYRVKVTVMLTDDGSADALLIARLPGVAISAVPQLDAAAFRQANLTTADAVAIVTSDDVGNVYAGLQAQETCPGIRLVLRVFNSTLGQRLGPLFENAQLLSDVEIAVPAFVAACLGTTEPTEVTIGGLVARVTTRAELLDGDEVWCGLAITDRRSMRLLPDDIDAADLVLSAPGPAAETSAVREVVTLRRYRRRRRLVPSPIVATVRATLRSVGALQPGIPAQTGETAATLAGAPTSRGTGDGRPHGFVAATRRAGRALATIIQTVPRRLLPGRVSRGVRVTLSIMAGLLLAGIAAYAIVDHYQMPFHTAWYSVYSMLLTAVGEANPDNTISVPLQVLQTIVTFTGVAMIPVVSAAIVQASVPALGRDRVADRNHVVVVGLGNVGTRVLRALHERGFPVVAVDHLDHAYGAQYVREQHIDFIVGDESRESTLRRANVAHAAAMVVMTSDDVVNLEFALQGQQLQPTLRVVLRLFDGDFAERVNEVFNVTISRSVSYLAASSFAAAMVGREVIGTIPVRRRVLLVADIPVFAGSGLAGRTLASFDAPGQVRVIALTDATGRPTVRPPTDRTLMVGDHMFVVATGTGLSQIVEQNAPAAAASESDPVAVDAGPAGRS
jgi:Trk K+ transport system NAD-binding subunit